MNVYRKLFISAFIILNFLFMFRVHLPTGTAFFKALYKPIDPIISFLGLKQSWSMFAPDPSRLNVYLTATVDFEDGTHETYVFPRSSELSLKDRYTYGDRFRVLSENVRNDRNSFMWKDAARFAMRNIDSELFFKIPSRVNLIRHWDVIPDPRKDFRNHEAHKVSYKTHKFYSYEIFQ